MQKFKDLEVAVRSLPIPDVLRQDCLGSEKEAMAEETSLKELYSQSFASPFMISLNSFRASTANAIIFASRSPPRPVSTSLVCVACSVAIASAT